MVEFSEIEFQQRQVIVDLDASMRTLNTQIQLGNFLLFGDPAKKNTGYEQSIRMYMGHPSYKELVIMNLFEKYIDEVRRLTVAYEELKQLIQGQPDRNGKWSGGYLDQFKGIVELAKQAVLEKEGAMKALQEELKLKERDLVDLRSDFNRLKEESKVEREEFILKEFNNFLITEKKGWDYIRAHMDQQNNMDQELTNFITKFLYFYRMMIKTHILEQVRQ